MVGESACPCRRRVTFCAHRKLPKMRKKPRFLDFLFRPSSWASGTPLPTEVGRSFPVGRRGDVGIAPKTQEQRPLRPPPPRRSFNSLPQNVAMAAGVPVSIRYPQGIKSRAVGAMLLHIQLDLSNKRRKLCSNWELTWARAPSSWRCSRTARCAAIGSPRIRAS